jgi:membrane fusion protein (multidrug efflux system)
MNRRRGFGPVLLFAALLVISCGLAAWKYLSVREAGASLASPPEPSEAVVVARAKQIEHHESTTSIGTVLALRSVTLKNELAGTVHDVQLVPGQVVEAGTVLVRLDVSVEEAELRAQRAQAQVAKTLLERVERASRNEAASGMEVDQARAERDVALAQVARTEALIAKKTIRAPFRARVGMADVHPGQYLDEGTQLTTLQGVDDAVHVDFTVAQRVAALLRVGDHVEVFAAGDTPAAAEVIAIDARVDPATRNAWIRAQLDAASAAAPGASVRVRVPVGPAAPAVVVPVSALRKGPAGDHVFVIAPDAAGKPRAHVRQVVSGSMLGDEVVIRSGLDPGEQVAASGSFKLREAVRVTIAEDAAAQKD